MSYFDKFPLIYIRTVDGNGIIIEDFFRRIKVGGLFGDVSVALVPYFVQEGETPEVVSNKFYGSPFYHWVILHINNIVNVYTEWPLSAQALTEKIAGDYDSPNGVHHYFNTANGYVVDRDDDNSDIIPVTNIEYENAVNDAKRTIKILDPQYLTNFVSNFTDMIGA